MATPDSRLTTDGVPKPVKLLVKIVYLPFGIIFGVLSGVVARKLFEALWSKVDEQEPPKATSADAPLPKILGSAALKSSVFSVSKAASEHVSARTFYYLFGVWPGATEAEKSES